MAISNGAVLAYPSASLRTGSENPSGFHKSKS